MEITKIVLTGGPKAGKTTIIEELKKYLKYRGYNVICVQETARDLIEGGISPFGEYEYILKFQDLVLKMQTSKEATIEEFVKNTYDVDTVIIYDRGVLDNKAYLRCQSDFDLLLKNNSMNEIAFSEKYDLIINLISSSKLGKDYYSKDESRFEDFNEALDLDYRTTIAWLLSPNIKVIEPTERFEDKVLKTIKCVDNCLSKKVEKKYQKEIDLNNSDFSDYNDNNSKTYRVTDYYLDLPNNNIEYIVTEKEYKSNTSYEFKGIATINDEKRLITRYLMNKEKFDQMLKEYGYVKEETRTEIRFLGENRVVLTIKIVDDKAIIESDIKDYSLPRGIYIKNNVKKLKF